MLNEEFEKELLISAPWEMIEENYALLIKRYSKLALKGFRPGKSPLGLIESSFEQQIKNDLLASASTRICRKALKELNMAAGSPVEISDSILQKNEYLQFKATFIQMPLFELPDYAHLKLQSENDNEKLDEVSMKLLDATAISLHPRFIENELAYSHGENSDESERAEAEARVKLMLILKKIALQDQIEIEEKDIEERLEALAAQNAVTTEYLKKFLIENKGLSRFADSLLAEAVLAYIIEIQD